MKNSCENNEENKKIELASCLSRLTFSWADPLIQISKERGLLIDDLPELSKIFDVNYSLSKFKHEFEQHKSLWRLLADNIEGKRKMILMNLVFALCEITNIGALYFLTEYFQRVQNLEESLDKRYLAMIFSIMMLSSTCLNVFEAFYEFNLFREFMKVKNNLSTLVADHILSVNIHSNSETSKGNLINLIQIDCATLESVGELLVMSTYVLFQFGLCFGVGFYLFGYVYGTFICCSVVFMFVGVFMQNISMKIEKEFMSHRDKRISLITGILSNIRFIKYNVLENYFIKLVYDSRAKEIALLFKIKVLGAFEVLVGWISPSLSKVIFISMYFLNNSKMAIHSYMAFINIDYLLGHTFSSLPMIFSSIFKTKLVFQRISNFLLIRPVNPISKNENQSSNDFLDLSKKSDKRLFSEEEHSREFLESEMSRQANSDRSKVPYAIIVRNANFIYSSSNVIEFEKNTHKTPSETNNTGDEQTNFDTKDLSIKKNKENETPETSNDNIVLQNIDIRIRMGELVLVVGYIGSGKSSLLLSLIGELTQFPLNKNTEYTEYQFIKDSYSYSPQKPFIQAKTVKENILFYENEDLDLLNKSIRMAFLQEDVSTFDNGLNKILVENGMNISGGQRSRINMARCFYKNSNVLLMDSPFNSLDFETSRKIMEETIVKELSGKTRVIVCNNEQFLKYADKILVMDGGRISFYGDFYQFNNSKFSSDVSRFLEPSDNGDKTDDEKSIFCSPELNEIIDGEIKPSKALDIVLIKNPDEANFNYLPGENLKTGRDIRSMFNLFFKYFGGMGSMLIMCVLNFLSQYVWYLASIFIYDVIEKNLTNHQQFWKNIQYYLALQIIPALISITRWIVISTFSLKVSKTLHHRMTTKTIYADISRFHDKTEPAAIISRFSGDFDKVDFYIPGYLDNTINLFACICFEIFLAKEATSILFVTIFIFYFIGIFYYQSKYIKARKELYQIQRTGSTPIVNLTNEIIEGSVIFKVFKKQSSAIKELNGYINNNTRSSLAIASLDGWFAIRLILLSVFFFQLLIFLYILILVDEKSIKFMQLEIFISLILTIVIDSKEFMRMFCVMETEVISLDRCDKVTRIRQEKGYRNIAREERLLSMINKVTPSSLLPKKTFGNDKDEKFDYEEINAFSFNKAFFTKGKIEFKSVYAKYPSAKDFVLKNLSFEVQPGEKLAIVGKTGSGKSTILKLLLHHLSPKKGEVVIDQYEVSKIDVKKLRSEFLVISQEIALFEGTLRDNLVYESSTIFEEEDQCVTKNKKDEKYYGNGNNLINDSELSILDILQSNSEERKNNIKAFESEVVDKLIEFGFSKVKLSKSGLDTRLTCNGDNLSAGEQQLISFFRAFFTQKQIILLDEATASFDSNLQRVLMEYFNTKVKGKTVISIAHKLLAVQSFDKLLMLENGSILEYGRIEELLADETSLFKKALQKYLKY
jgi:ABC-type multidrug transport system fused ATPase/permease subunit